LFLEFVLVIPYEHPASLDFKSMFDLSKLVMKFVTYEEHRMSYFEFLSTTG
jgi:hypothetical protein